MTLHTALSIFLLGVSECSLSNEFALEETSDKVTPQAREMSVKNIQADSILSIPLYLPLAI